MDYLVKEIPTTEAETAPTQVPEQSPLFRWLTGEVLIYTLIVLAAAGLRFANLGAYPLNDAEAAQALVGYDVSQGHIPAEAEGYSPLIVTLNSLAFLLFDDSDGTARFGAALLGMVLLLLPLGLRRQVGVSAALATSALFAMSASTLFWSRTASGEIAVAVGSLMIWVGVLNWLDLRSKASVLLTVTGLVFLLTGAPSGFTALLILLVFVIYVAVTNQSALAVVQTSLSQVGLTVGQAALFGAALLVIVGTTVLFNLTGLAAISDLFTAWLRQFGLQSQPGAGYPAILMLFFYEPLLLIFGIVGMILAFRLSELFSWFLIIWLGLAIILDLFMGGRSQGQILLAVVPLGLLAGQAIGQLVDQLLTRERRDIEGLFVGFGLIITVFVYISLTSWSKCDAAQAGCSTAWVLPVAGTVLLIALFAIFWGWYGADNAGRSIGLLALVVVGLFSIGISWRLNYGPLKDIAFQPMVAQPASTRLETLMTEVARLSAARTGDPGLIDIAVVDYDRPMLHWHLRHFANVDFVDNFNSAVGASIVLAAPDIGQPVGGSYVGQDLALIASWSPRLVVGKDWLRWYLYRFLMNHVPGSDQIILWAREG